MMSNTRCVNIDWLEVYALEPIERPHTPDYYRECGLNVAEREYGTRTYNQMFKIQDEYGFDILEIRREPKQAKFEKSILPINACHIRLSNRTCYSVYAANILKDFCRTYNITIVKIFRIDICLDFERFDSGDDPGVFLHRYIKRKYSKINQAEGYGRFLDRWDGRRWNSISWGSHKSAVYTKMYNKTLELREVKDKPYIRQAWFNSGLIDNPLSMTKKKPDGTEYTPEIWRVEFSIKSGQKNWLTYEKDGNPKEKRSIRNTLAMYDEPQKILTMFAMLSEHYFHFRHYVMNKSKYECPRKELFKFDGNDKFISVEHPSTSIQPEREDIRLLRLLEKFRLLHAESKLRQAVDTVIEAIRDEDTKRLLANPWSKVQLMALKRAIAARMGGDERDPAVILRILENYFKEYSNIF